MSTVMTGGSLKLGQLIRSGAVGAVIGGVVGGLRGGANAKKEGFDYWSGEGESVHKIDLPSTFNSDSSTYTSSQEMRNDYNRNIGSKDNLNLEQVETRLSVKVDLANANNLPDGYFINNDGLLADKYGSAGGITFNKNPGGIFSKTSSEILISPGLKGFDLNIKNMVFKHEFMHSWHWKLNPNHSNFDKYSERATSSFSLAYVKSIGGYPELEQLYRDNIGVYPKYMGWHNFNKYIPTWIK